MKRLLLAAAVLALVWAFWPRAALQTAPTPAREIDAEPALSLRPDPPADAAEELRKIHASIHLMLTALKDPYRPPLGINEEFARALSGGNRQGDVFLPTNHPALRNGQLIDAWGTPYHFHPRAPDAIDLRSAGPDRRLFTADDLAVSRIDKIVE